jgi:hypothetical protein
MKACILLLLLTLSLNAQEVHHQMISSQGGSIKTSTGLIVKQTIGQQSVSGNNSGEMVVQQGFQQSYWEKHLIKENNDDGIVITTFPNPFEGVINFQFSELIEKPISVSIYDIHGRLIFLESLSVIDNLITLELSELSNAEYLVRLSGEKINYFTKIIKKL